MMQNAQFHQMVIIGGGFGGLYAAKALRRAPVRATLVNKRNFHLFQPLLYQVVAGSLSPGDIAYPLRSVFAHDDNLAVIMAEVIDIDVSHCTVILRDGSLTYNTLIIATGASHQYFGHDEWAQTAPGLKTIEDAPEIRRRIFLDFEMAEREPDPERRRALAAFVIVDGTPVAGRVSHRRRMAQTHYLELSELTQLPPSYIAWQKQQTGASSLSCMLARGESVGGDGLQSQC